MRANSRLLWQCVVIAAKDVRAGGRVGGREEDGDLEGEGGGGGIGEGGGVNRCMWRVRVGSVEGVGVRGGVRGEEGWRV